MGTTWLAAAGVRSGDEVVVPAYGGDEVAVTAQALGARPVCADIDPHTFCLTADTVLDRVTPRTVAVVGVPLFGHSVDAGQLAVACGPHGVRALVWGQAASADEMGARRRRQHAEVLGRRLNGLGKPVVAEGAEHTFTEYVVRVPGNGRPDRDAFKRALEARGIACRVPVRVPVHRRPEFFSEVRLPEAERACEETLALELRASMTKRELSRVVSACNALGGLVVEPAS